MRNGTGLLVCVLEQTASPDLGKLILSQSNGVPLKAKSGRLSSGASERDLEAGGLPLPELLDGTKRMLLTLYDPRRFYERALDSLERCQFQPEQRAPALSLRYLLRVLLKSVWKQGVLSGYRRTYWRYMRRLMLRWGLQPQKRRLGFELALSGHHFIRYARQVAESLEAESRRAIQFRRPGFVPQSDGQARNLVQINRVAGHS